MRISHPSHAGAPANSALLLWKYSFLTYLQLRAGAQSGSPLLLSNNESCLSNGKWDRVPAHINIWEICLLTIQKGYIYFTKIAWSSFGIWNNRKILVALFENYQSECKKNKLAFYSSHLNLQWNELALLKNVLQWKPFSSNLNSSEHTYLCQENEVTRRKHWGEGGPHTFTGQFKAKKHNQLLLCFLPHLSTYIHIPLRSWCTFLPTTPVGLGSQSHCYPRA